MQWYKIYSTSRHTAHDLIAHDVIWFPTLRTWYHYQNTWQYCRRQNVQMDLLKFAEVLREILLIPQGKISLTYLKWLILLLDNWQCQKKWHCIIQIINKLLIFPWCTWSYFGMVMYLLHLKTLENSVFWCLKLVIEI